MGTLLKYLLYALILIAIYLVGAGLYEGTINGKTTVAEVGEEVDSGTKKILKNGYDATKNAVEKEYRKHDKK